MTEQEKRQELFAAIGTIVDVTDVMRAIAASSRLASQKLERLGAALTRIAIATGEPEE
jgi:hypothetical protein